MLELRSASGAVKRATLRRRREDFYTRYHRERTGDVVRMLPGNVGYVDLDRLTLDMVDPMLERLKGARCIVLDMRAYPNGTIWAMAPRFADSSVASRATALLKTPMVGFRTPAPAVQAFFETVKPAAPRERHYRGPTVMLVDERTVSQAELAGMTMRAANGARFVGTRTAGANGEIATITLPGGIVVGFTGQSVRWPDGRQLQRRGLVPDVEVRATIAGVRAGRDEVLEAGRVLTPAGILPLAPGGWTAQCRASR